MNYQGYADKKHRALYGCLWWKTTIGKIVSAL